MLPAQVITRELDQTNLEFDYLRQLEPVIRHFTTLHADHELFLACDLGIEPWSIGADFAEWKEIPAYLNYLSFLPRHFIEDLRIESWQEAEAYLQTHHDWLFQSEEIITPVREAFEKAAQQHRLSERR